MLPDSRRRTGGRADDLGVSGSALARMERQGILHRVVPGIDLGAEHRRHPSSRRRPGACATRVPWLTAAVYHELTDAFARGTWLFVPKGCSPPRSRVAKLYAVQTAPRLGAFHHDTTNGIVAVSVHGVSLRITNPDRTTIDLWRFPDRIPREHALEALRRRAHAPDFDLPAFARLASRPRAWNRLEPVVQGLTLR